MQGVHFVRMPTSLTAQVDSSIGGKRVSMHRGQEHGGYFYSARWSSDRSRCFKNFGTTELIEGNVGEVIKYGLIEDVELWKELA